MPYSCPLNLSASLLVAIFATLPGAASAQGLIDCTLPLRPTAVTDPRLQAEYAAEIREEYGLYFDEAQDFFHCLERARLFVTEDVNRAIADYGAIAGIVTE